MFANNIIILNATIPRGCKHNPPIMNLTEDTRSSLINFMNLPKLCKSDFYLPSPSRAWVHTTTNLDMQMLVYTLHHHMYRLALTKTLSFKWPKYIVLKTAKYFQCTFQCERKPNSLIMQTAKNYQVKTIIRQDNIIIETQNSFKQRKATQETSYEIEVLIILSQLEVLVNKDQGTIWSINHANRTENSTLPLCWIIVSHISNLPKKA